MLGADAEEWLMRLIELVLHVLDGKKCFVMKKYRQRYRSGVKK